MVFVFIALSSIAGTVFSVAFVTWIVALIIDKKDLIQMGGNPVILITGWIALAYVSKLLI